MEFLAAIPMIPSAIRVEGEAGGCSRVIFEINITNPSQYGELADLRGKELVLSIREANNPSTIQSDT